MTKRNLARLAALSLACAATITATSCAQVRRLYKHYFPDEYDPAALTVDVTEAGTLTVPDMSAGEILDYFCDVALDSEYGETEHRVCRWESPISYTVEGAATDEDLALIAELCDRLNEIDGFPGIRKAIIAQTANFTVSFVPREEIPGMFTSADENCVGMAEYSWDVETGEILSARAAITADLTDERESTICEEFLQSLGPANDSYEHIDSVFYEGRTLVPRPSKLDWAVLALLYSPKLTTGADKKTAMVQAAGVVAWNEEETK